MTMMTGQNEIDRVVTDLVHVGRMWAAHGLTVGKIALRGSAKTLEVTADSLAQLARGFAPPAPANEGAPLATEVAISDNLVSSSPGCDNGADEADAGSSHPGT
jgi:hypothetical protein